MTVICDECGDEMETAKTAEDRHSSEYTHECPTCGNSITVRTFLADSKQVDG